MAQTVIKR